MSSDCERVEGVEESAGEAARVVDTNMSRSRVCEKIDHRDKVGFRRYCRADTLYLKRKDSPCL
eukprot:1150293-Pelagomonas_calceolata.AAC.8